MAVEELNQSDKAGDGKGSDGKSDLSAQTWDLMKSSDLKVSDPGKSGQAQVDEKGMLVMQSCYGDGETGTATAKTMQLDSKVSAATASDTGQSEAAGKTSEATELKDTGKIDRATAIDEAKHAGTLGDAPYSPVRIHRSDDGPDTVTWTDPDGRNIKAELGKGGRVTGGTISDANGDEVGKISGLDGSHIVYQDENGTHLKEINIDPRKGIQVREKGEYNPDEGTITAHKGSDYTKTETVAPGGREEVSSANDTHWSTARGDFGMITKPDGTVLVGHKDGTVVKLEPDGKLDMTNEKGERHTGKLSHEEEQYLKKHPDIDKRDLAEIHRRLDPHQDKIDAFYHSMEKIDTAKNLTDEQRTALRRDVMHHVASPQDIYQGSTESCNVSVIERDMAMNDPKKYVDVITHAVSDEKIHTPNGDVPVNAGNLTMMDSSGRDLASRVFQTAALRAEFWPTKEYFNTADGTGQLNPGDRGHNKGADHPVPFDGLMPAEVADVQYKMTGQEKSVAFIQSGDELDAAVRKNGTPLTIAVDSTAHPFHNDMPGDHKANHVVSITGVVEGPPRKYLVQNQWGPANDHSTPETAINEDDLIKNMKGSGRVGTILTPSIDDTTHHVKGNHRQLIANGEVQSDFDILTEQQKNRWEAEKRA